MSSSACAGRGSGHSAGDAGRLREPARSWAPAVCRSVSSPAGTAGLAVPTGRRGSGGDRPGFIPFLGGCSESAQTGRLTWQQFVLSQPGGGESTARRWHSRGFWRPRGGRFLLHRAFPGRQPRHPGLCRRPHTAPCAACPCLHFSLLVRTPVTGQSESESCSVVSDSATP